MKQEDLQSLNLSEEQLSAVLALAQIDEQTIQTLQATNSNLEVQLGKANETLEGYDPEWKTKAKQAQIDAENKIVALQREFATKEQTASLQFSSNSAKKAFLAELLEKQLPLQDGKLLGFDDFVKQYGDSDPDAFLKSEKLPRFAGSTIGIMGGNISEKDKANAAIRAVFGK